MKPLSFLEHAGPQEIIKAYKNGWGNRPREFSQFLSKQKFGQGTSPSKWGALLAKALDDLSWRSWLEKEDLKRAEDLLKRIKTLKELSDLHKIANSSEGPSTQARRIVKI